jgi:hypothetical protein
MGIRVPRRRGRGRVNLTQRGRSASTGPPAAGTIPTVLRYHLLLLVKFAGVLLFAGGAMASFVASDLEARKGVIHRQGSLGLLLTWLSGFGLAHTLGWTLTQLWLIAGLAVSFVTQGILTWSVAAPGRPKRGPAIAVGALITVTLAIMIWKPTWKLVGL